MDIFSFHDFMKDIKKPDYIEPEKPENVLELAEKGLLKKKFVDAITELDCYIGVTDGYAYKSHDRLSRMRSKLIFKPVGPSEMYRFPGTDSMKYGWFLTDAEMLPLLENNWHKCTRIPKNYSEMTKNFQFCLSRDKQFKM